MTSGTVHVHYWASARSAAGTPGDDLAVNGPITLAELRDLAIERHQGTKLGDVLAICSTLVGDRPVNADDPASVIVEPGSNVEFLPPFAGG